MPLNRRVQQTMLAGNLGGALLTFAYFGLLDPSALAGVTAPRAPDVVFFVLAFALLFLLGRMLAGRWISPILRHTGALPAEPGAAALRRRALLVPVFLAGLTWFGWVMAALVWGFGLPLLTGRFELAAAVRQGFGIVFVSGTVVTVFIFLATERLWRTRLPTLFPAGDLEAAGAPHLRVRTRLVLLFLVMSVLPMAVLSVATMVRANALLGADATSHAAMIRNLMLVQASLAGAGLLAALRLAGFAAGSVAEPLRALQTAMDQVAQGRLDAKCPVVSNDELGAVSEGFNRMVAGLRERERIRDAFGRYMSPQVRDEILTGRASLGGGQREVTILFADLRDFTGWAETSPPEEVVAGLNAYFTEMDAAIRAHGGLVLQFIGDEIEAVFGAPLPDPRHADRAVAAALEMQRRLAESNRARAQRGQRQLRHGIGIHSGTVVAGNIGSSERMAYSLVGDAVNVASRIQALNKQFGTTMLLSEATRALLRTPQTLQPMETVRVKGRSAEVAVFALE